MLLELMELLSTDTTNKLRSSLEEIWSNHQQARSRVVGNTILDALHAHPFFIMATRPLKISPVEFFRYTEGMELAGRFENAIIGSSHPMRVDMCVTVFLSEPSEYMGGETVLEYSHGTEVLKDAAGTCIVFPASIRAGVKRIQAGIRWTAELKVESLIRSPMDREILYDVTYSRHLAEVFGIGNNEQKDRIRRCEQELLRLWAQT